MDAEYQKEPNLPPIEKPEDLPADLKDLVERCTNLSATGKQKLTQMLMKNHDVFAKITPHLESVNGSNSGLILETKTHKTDSKTNTNTLQKCSQGDHGKISAARSNSTQSVSLGVTNIMRSKENWRSQSLY